ncbi:hypothetical protein BGZ76_008265 [Entomortierella beljakovae]|nr:hypothetical protein BGZ76_008265 [Entomortierella beljakovae]
MSTSRPSSRNQRTLSNGSSAVATAVPRRAKVSSVAQMDISSVAFGPKSTMISGPNTTTSTISSRGPSSTTSYSNTNISNGNGNGNYPSNGSVSNGNSNNGTPQRVPSLRVRSSNSVTSTASLRNSNGGSSNSSGRKDGSVTSDDGTVSEDSDLARDDMQLFSGGQGNVGGGINIPFGTSSRPVSGSGCNTPKITTSIVSGSGGSGGLSRHRSSSSIVGLSGFNGTPKPMRIAAGASIKIDSVNGLPGHSTSITSSQSSLGISNIGSSTSPNSPNNGATVPVWSSPSAPSLSRNGSLRHSWGGGGGGSVVGDDASSTISASSANPNQSTARSTKNSGSVNNKQAEESRRAGEAARTRRKIQDLEISNNSLLSLNQSLESSNRKLSNEIQELKTRMQSAHLGELGYTAADLALAQSVEAIELTEEEKNDDMTFKRLCSTIEQMVYEAKHALDQTTKPTGVRVLTLYEMYEKEVEEEEEDEEDNLEEGDNSHTIPDQQEKQWYDDFINYNGSATGDGRLIV